MRLLPTLLALTLTCIPQLAASRTNPLVHAMNNTVEILEFGGKVRCSGAIIEAHIVTAAHCVSDDEALGFSLIRWRDSFMFADHAALVPKQDLAVLTVEEGLPWGMELSKKIPALGQEVFIGGSPLGLSRTLTKGIISNPHRVRATPCLELRCHPSPWTQVDAFAFWGTSGSPIFSRKGKVLGVISFIIHDQGNLVGAIHLHTIRNLIKQRRNK